MEDNGDDWNDADVEDEVDEGADEEQEADLKQIPAGATNAAYQWLSQHLNVQGNEE